MPERGLPSQAPPGFQKCTGIPNTVVAKSYFATTAEAIARCIADPKCVGISAQRLFYGVRSGPATVAGRPGEETCFLRTT